MNKDKLKKLIKNEYFIISILTITAFLIRLLNIDKVSGMWFDEMSTFIFASKHFPDGILKNLVNHDAHMPLYYLCLNLWMKLFGNSDVILRLFSVLFGMLTIPALYLLGKTYRSKELGYLVAVLGCISPVLIYYSQEVRFYSAVIFLSVISLILFLKLLDCKEKKHLVLFHLINLILLYTYSMGWAFVLAELCILAYHYKSTQNNYLKAFLFSLLPFSIFALPYLVLMLYFIYNSNNMLLDYFAWTTAYKNYPILIIFDWFSPVLANLYRNETYIYTQYFTNLFDIFYLSIMLLPTFCFLFGLFKSIINMKNNKKGLYLLIIFLSVINIDCLLVVFKSFNLVTKYTLIVFPIILLLGSEGLMLIKIKKVKIALFAIILGVYLFNIINYKNMIAFESRICGLLPAAKYLMQLNPNEDYILSLEGTSLYKKYLKKYKYIEFEGYRMLYNDYTKKDALKVFGNELVLKTNTKNAYESFKPYIISSEPTKELATYINTQANIIPKGKRIIYIEGPYTGRIDNYNYIHEVANYDKDYKANIFNLLIGKIDLDIKNLLSNNPHLLKTDTTILKLNPIFRYYINVYKKL